MFDSYIVFSTIKDSTIFKNIDIVIQNRIIKIIDYLMQSEKRKIKIETVDYIYAYSIILLEYVHSITKIIERNQNGIYNLEEDSIFIDVTHKILNKLVDLTRTKENLPEFIIDKIIELKFWYSVNIQSYIDTIQISGSTIDPDLQRHEHQLNILKLVVKLEDSLQQIVAQLEDSLHICLRI